MCVSEGAKMFIVGIAKRRALSDPRGGSVAFSPRIKVTLKIGEIRPPCTTPRARCELVSQVLGKHISEGGKISKH